MADHKIVLALVAAALATYVWRAAGVFAAGRLRVDGGIFMWVTYVAYGLLASLVARMIVQPVGSLQTVPLPVRIGAAAGALAVYFLARRSIAAGVATGAGLIAAYAWLFGG